MSYNKYYGEGIGGHERIWKYMSFTKFMSLIDSKSLFFCRADKFEDMFEGIIPVEIKSTGEEKYKSAHDDIRNRTFINCWSLNDHESYAMWKIYSSKNDGVCIQTTVERLKDSLRAFNKKCPIIRVKYIDFRKEKVSLERLNEVEFYSYKSKAYEYEKEVRVIHVGDENRSYENISVDLDALIDNIYVHPAASDWFIHLVGNIFKKYNLNKSVKHSRIVIQD